MKLFNEEETKRLTKQEVVLLSNRMLKTQEELGELSQEVLKYSNSPLASKSATGTSQAMLEEACDVLNCAMSLVFHIQEAHDISDEYVQEMYNMKLQKWASKF